MMGTWFPRMAATIGAVAAAAAPALVLTGAPAAAAAATVSCTYTVTSAWPGGFVANLSIANSGPTISGWTARWTFPDPASGLQPWSAVMILQGNAVTATNMSWNGVIATGATVDFGWSALGDGTAVPTDITVNGTPC